MKEIVLTVPENTKEFIESSIRWHQMIYNFKNDAPNNEIRVFLKEEHSNATEQDLYSEVNFYGLDSQVAPSPIGLAHIAKSGAPLSSVFNYVMSITSSQTQESVLEALNAEGIKSDFNFWFDNSLPTARSLELMIAIGCNPDSIVRNITNYYTVERDVECTDLLQAVLKNGTSNSIPNLYAIPSFLPTNAIELLIENGLDSNILAKTIYNLSLPKHNIQTGLYETATASTNLEELATLAVRKGLKLNDYFTEQLSKKSFYAPPFWENDTYNP